MVEARSLHLALLGAIVVGLGFSLFAAFEVFLPSLASSCSANPWLSCSAVLRSGHTTFPPGTTIPDWAWGVGGFAALLALDIPLFAWYQRPILIGVLALSGIGLALAVTFGFVAVTEVRALCPVCLGAYLSDATAFGCAFVLVRKGSDSSVSTTA